MSERIIWRKPQRGRRALIGAILIVLGMTLGSLIAKAVMP
jgi:hypothetical protein